VASDLIGGDAGTLEISFAGTGYTAASSEKISIAPGSYTATYSLYNFFINMPAFIPADFEIVVKVTGTMTNLKNVYIDSLALGPVQWHGGVGITVVAGGTRFRRNDRFTWTIANTDAGVFQTAFRKGLLGNQKVQLPSVAAAATILDSWAT